MPKLLSKKQKNKLDIIERLEKAGFPIVEASPYRHHIVYYLNEDFDILKDLVPDLNDLSTSGASWQYRYIDNYNMDFIGVNKHKDPAIFISRISHELIHCINGIYSMVGQKWDLDNDEHSAYLMEDLLRKAVWAFEPMIKFKETRRPKGKKK